MEAQSVSPLTHMFGKANIEFVLLERGPTCCPDRGASLAMYPSTIRIFDQLGLCEALCAELVSGELHDPRYTR